MSAFIYRQVFADAPCTGSSLSLSLSLSLSQGGRLADGDERLLRSPGRLCRPEEPVRLPLLRRGRVLQLQGRQAHAVQGQQRASREARRSCIVGIWYRLQCEECISSNLHRVYTI